MHPVSLRRAAEITHTTDPHCGQAPGWPWRRVPKLAASNTSADSVQKGGKAPTAGPVPGRPVEPRTTSSGSKSSSSGYTAMFSIWFTSNATAALPIDSIGCLTVVSGGSVQFMNAESSYPTTETSPGTDRPARRMARTAQGQHVAGADDTGRAVPEQPRA